MRYCAHMHLLAQIWQFKSRSDLKNESRSSKPNQLFIMYQYHISMQIWLKSVTQFMRYGAHKLFWLKFVSLSPAVTLKIRPRSQKPNQLFIRSQCYIRANLAKIHPPVHETSRIQESVTPTLTLTLTLTPTLSAQKKTICPPPLRWGT